MEHYNEKIAFSPFKNCEVGIIELYRIRGNWTDVSELRSGCDIDTAKQIAALLGCEVEILDWNDRHSKTSYIERDKINNYTDDDLKITGETIDES